MDDIKRPNYFTFQFLVEKDFDDEQAYHMGMRRRHNRLAHAWGVAGDGLVVTRESANEVKVSAGTAIDKDGREIVLQNATEPYTLTTIGTDPEVYLAISYAEVFDPLDHYTEGAVDNYTRATERPKIQDLADAPPADGTVIVLARIVRNAAGEIDSIDNNVRRLVSANVSQNAVSTENLAD